MTNGNAGMMTQRCAESGGSRARRPDVWLWLALAASLGVAGCGSDDKPDTIQDITDAAPEVTADVADVGTDATTPEPDGDDQIDSAEAISEDSLDMETAPEVVADVLAEVEPVDTSECATATDCTGLALSLCQQAACVAGTCTAEPLPGACCQDDDCDDKIECTENKCDTATHACVFPAIVNCCSGKVTLVKTGFETNTFEEFKATEGPTNGSVDWHVTGNRAHSGQSSLYFGNECYSYDTTMTLDSGCFAGPNAAPVATTLLSKEYALPKDKKVQLHFWLYLDTEPSYSDSLPKGSCPVPCPAGSSCISVNGASQCLPEKDVLQVTVFAPGQVAPVFLSTSIGKTTGGKWQHVAADLSAWSGQAVKVQWGFSTGTGLKNAFEGIYLDDVVIETTCGSEGTVCDLQSPCTVDNNPCTIDTCTPYSNANGGAGGCFFDKTPGCCVTPSDCNDGNTCTIDACPNGQCQNNPDIAKPACCKSEVLAFDDFDSGDMGSWVPLFNNSNLVKWRINPTGGVANSQALYFGNETFDSFADSSLGKDTGPKGTLCTKSVKLKKGTNFNLASFDLRMETEWSGLQPAAYKNPAVAGGTKFDELTLTLYIDGNFVPAWSSDAVYGTTEGKWLPVTIPLDKWQGKAVQACLTFDAGDAMSNNLQGVTVDNFVIKVACSKKACYFDNDCASLTCGACGVASCADTGCLCAKVPGCCTQAADCDDANACTIDACGALGQCGHEPSGDPTCAAGG